MKTKKLVDLFLSNPTKENFAAMKDDVVAISLVYAKLKDKKKLTTFLDFDEAQKFYHTFDGELKTAAFQKMEELATTLDELNELFSNSGIQGKELIFQKMKVLVLPFEKWETAYRSAKRIVGEGGFTSEVGRSMYRELAHLAFEKMQETATTFWNWKKIFEDSPEKSKALAFKKMQETATTFTDWKEVYRHSNIKERKFALQKLGKFEKTFEEWEVIYKDVMAGLDSLAFKKMQAFNNKTFAEWDAVYHSAHARELGNEQRTMALKKMWKLAKTFSEWDIIVGRIESKKKALVIKKMGKLAKTFEEWCTVATPAEGKLKELAFQKIKEANKTRCEWINIYSSKSYADEVKILAFQKIRENSKTFEECMEIYSSTGLSELKELVLTKVEAINDKNFEEWKKILERGNMNWDLRSLLIEKMGNLAKNYDDWEFVYRNSNGDLRAKAFNKMVELT